MQPAGNIAGIEYLVCMSASDVPHFRKRGMLRDCEAARSASLLTETARLACTSGMRNKKKNKNRRLRSITAILVYFCPRRLTATSEEEL